MKKLVLVLCIFILMSSTIYAAEDMKIMEANTGEDTVTVFVKGVEAGANISKVQIGTAVCNSVQSQTLSEGNIPLQTLIMVDNSLSIKEKDREKIGVILQNMIADRVQGEEISLAVFGEEITYLSEYTEEYAMLKAATDELSYVDQETYLTDVLYELVTSEFRGNPSEKYRRIIIISDGVDNKSLGYTKEELYTLLKEYPLPIYTIGCETGKNNEQLENMFALSRVTGADYFQLGELEDLLYINSILNKDREIWAVRIEPEAALLDGSRKTIKLTFGEEDGSASISAEVVLPQKQEIVVEEPQKPKVVEAMTQPVMEQEEERHTGIIVAAVSVVFLVIIAVIVYSIIRKRKKKEEVGTVEKENVLQEEQIVSKSAGMTEVINNYVESYDGRTQLLWSQRTACQIILTDIHSPVRTYQMPMKDSIIIGRKSEFCDLVIDYEKSVSGRHCEIKSIRENYYISDLQSANGTYINNKKAEAEVEIFPGDIIKLGRVEFKFEVR